MKSNASPNFPPGPTASLWGLNHLQAMQKDYLAFVAGLQRQHPDVAHVQVFNEHISHVFHPDWVRQVLVEQSDALIRWERATDVFSMSMGQSVLVTEGAQWQRQRRMLQPGFSPKRVAGYAGLMVSATRAALQDLTHRPAKSGVDIESVMTRTTLDVILLTLFGRHEVTDPGRVSDAIQTLSHHGFAQFFRPFSWPLWMPWPAERGARRALKTLDELIDGHIARAQAFKENGGDELLTMLRLAEDSEGGEKLSAQELHDQTMVMFQAGHETSATALTWWCGLMARHPEVAERIHAEVDAALQGTDPSPESLQKLPWLQASLKEALRLYPPAAILFTRRAQRDIKVGPWTLPKGHLMAFTPFVIQRDSRWFESPDEFKPERFLPGAPEIQRGAWMPFGAGPRVCIGQHFAMLEMGIIAAMLMQRFRMRWPVGTEWPKTNLAVTLRPMSRMVLEMEIRRDSPRASSG